MGDPATIVEADAIALAAALRCGATNRAWGLNARLKAA
jgi:hypothetical protein